jgi:hypothetical protein
VRRTTHLHLKIECCGDDYFFRFTVCYTFDFGWSVLSFLMIHNVPTLGEEADLEARNFSLVQKPIESTNVQISTKTAFLPNVCYRLFLFTN